MSALKLQLNTPIEITRDLRVEVVNQLSGRSVDTTPFLDGTVSVRNLDAGRYRVKVLHPNIPFAVLDQSINVLTARPTFVPLKIDLGQFENTPVRDIPDEDLGPVREQLGDAGDLAERLAVKRGGEPIFADDWNQLAGTVQQVAVASVDLTRRVSANGHDHPELIEKLDEIQRNMQRFLEVFGRSMAQLQRQVRQLALKQQADEALDKIPNLPPARRTEVQGLIDRLGAARHDDSYRYLREFRRTGELLTNVLAEVLPADDPDIAASVEVAEFTAALGVMTETMPAGSVEGEVQTHLRIDQRSTKGNLAAVLGTRRAL